MYARILHATDLSEKHFHICEQAMQIAQRFNAKLYLLHVIEPPVSLQLAQGLGFAEFDNPDQIKADAQAVLATLGEAINVPLQQQFVEIGPINSHVFEKIKELACELVIIGSHTPSNLPQFLGSTAHTIVQQANCDVLTLRVP